MFSGVSDVVGEFYSDIGLVGDEGIGNGEGGDVGVEIGIGVVVIDLLECGDWVFVGLVLKGDGEGLSVVGVGGEFLGEVGELLGIEVGVIFDNVFESGCVDGGIGE